MKKIRVVHYLNQFFAGIGGEDKADYPIELREEVVGPGLAIKAALGDDGEIVATIVCGDNYFSSNEKSATEEILGLIAKFEPDVLIAGPAFNAGRYGFACGAVCKAVGEKFNIPVVTGMYQENPGVDSSKNYAYIVKTGNSAADMRKAVPAMVALVKKIVSGEALLSAEEEGCFAPGAGVRVNFFHSERGSKRAVDMLMAKIKGEPFVTEYPMPEFDRVAANPPVADLTKITIALVTSGGIVPKGNPDRIESSSASKYGRYDITGITDCTAETFETAHGGYDPVYANQDADRVLPLDVMRELEAEGVIGKLYHHYYATVGNGTSVANAKAYAAAIGAELKENGVEAVILTST